jgi:4-amino-4-deoxy-L-arabinose transferase-like glycosyltransferase
VLRLTPRGAAAGLALLVAASAALRLLAAADIPGPFIAPDEMIYSLLGRSLWSDGQLSILGGDTGFYSLLYPAFVGLPLSVGSFATGFQVLQAVQAVVVSLTAVVVYLWGRSFLTPGWALAAAALSLTPPALAYSGLVMTESLFLPLVALAAWALARAIEQPTLARQAVLGLAVAAAVATRLQGVVLLPVAVTAIVLHAAFLRDAGRLRRWLPAGAFVAVLAVGWLGWRATAGSWSSVFGAYEAALSGYEVGDAAEFVAWHLADVLLLCAGVPLLAAGALTVEAVAGRLREPRETALLAVALSLAAWLVVQVGVFSSQFVGHFAERDLITALPPLFLAFALWLQRGAPRTQPWTALLSVAVAIPALLLPIDRFATLAAAPDAFMTIPLEDAAARWGMDALETAWPLGVAVVVAAFVLIPRRFAPALAVGVGVLLAATSVVASREVTTLAEEARDRFFGGGDPSWIDHATREPTTVYYDGSAYWNSVWHQVLWNDRIRSVVHVPGAPVPGPIPQRAVSPRFDGLLFDVDGGPVEGPMIVAPTVQRFGDEPVAQLEQHDLDRAGLALWNGGSPVRLRSQTSGVLPNGDFTEARVIVYACPQGRLELTLLPKAGNAVELFADGAPVERATLDGEFWNGVISAPPTADGSGSCEFLVRANGLVGSTRMEFVAT